MSFKYSFINWVVIGSIGLLVGFLVGAKQVPELSSNRGEIGGYNKYGVLVIPILDSCPVYVSEDESEYIDGIEIFDFDKNIRGLNSHEFMVVNYSGPPSATLTFVHEKMKICLPDVELTFDSSLSLTEAFEEIITKSEMYEISLSRPVYIKIDNGVIEAFYKRLENDSSQTGVGIP